MATVASRIAPQKIVTHLWFAKDALEAVKQYVSLIPGSSVDAITPVPADTPSGPAGSVKVIDFTLAGQRFIALEAGPLDPFNHSISLLVNCADQAELDRIWEGLAAGGTIEQCGWLRDRWGVSWQIVPAELEHLMRGPQADSAARVVKAFLGMKKLDLEALRRAARST